MLSQQQPASVSAAAAVDGAAIAPASLKEDGDAKAAPEQQQQQPSAPTTPSYATSLHDSTTASTSTSSFTDDSSVPQEGLNGSNVPGLPPSTSSAQAPANSVPASRRTSGMPDDLTANDQARLAAGRASINGGGGGGVNMSDMAASFDRMGLASTAQQQQQSAQAAASTTTNTPAAKLNTAAAAASMRGSPAPSASPSQSGGNGNGNLFGTQPTAANGQQTLLHRAMNRSALDGQQHHSQQQQHHQQQHQHHVQQPHQHSDASLTPVFNERFLFSDDELEADDSTFVKKYNLNEDDNSFPVLIRHESQPGMLSASSAALDLAPLAQTPSRFARGDVNASEWPQFAHRDGADGSAVSNNVPSHGSMGSAGMAGQQSGANGGAESFDRFGARRGGRSERNSPRMSAGARNAHLTTTPVTPGSMGRSTDGSMPRSSTGSHFGHSGAVAPRPGGNNGLAGQGFHSPHDRSTDDGQRKEQSARAGHSQDSQQSVGTGGNAKGLDGASGGSAAFAPFAMGPGFPSDGKRNGSGGLNTPVGRFGPSYGAFDNRAPGGDAGSNRSSSGFFEAFAAPGALGKPGPGMQKGSSVSRLGGGGVSGTSPDSFGLGPADHAGSNAAAGLNGNLKGQQRKGELDTNTPLEELQGEIFALCKDQHGCRYLQKKLEEGNPTYRDMIFTETFSHFAELMTDPFGNYLCQKMLEYCTDDQRNLIVESVAPDLVSISLNMHGTRAVQKTIDFLSTPRQIHSIIIALGMNVVPLIKDLNGNHVVQKCLNRLNASDNQFIYDAVATHCVEVATHRHGCCVLQRCIDHASDKQRMQLVQEITFHALTLVQDPFGNYVVQYILDLNDSRFSEALVRQFVGHVCNLSVQKFSSNVIEKCIRVSEPGVRKQLIDELLNRTRLEKLLRDSFANYVVQTSLDYADPVQRMQLVECIKPTLPMIRNTPYGKRIQSKLQRDNIDLGGPPPGNMPYGMMQAAAHQQQQMHAMAAMAHRQGGPGGVAGGDFGPGPAMHHQAGPYGGGGGGAGSNAGNYMPGGNPRSYGARQGMPHIPPQVMYGGAGGSPARSAASGAYSPGNGPFAPGAGVAGGAAGFGAPNTPGAGGAVGGAGAAGYNRGPPQHHGGMGFGGHPHQQQQVFGPNAAVMQNGFGGNVPFPGQTQFGGGQF